MPIYRIFIKNPYLKKRRRNCLRYSDDALLAAKKALDSINAFFWIDFGTLLGVVREGTFLKDDIDIDISMFLSDYTPAVDAAMKKQGFKKTREFKVDEGSYAREQTYKYHGLSLDIFFYTRYDGGMYTYAFAIDPNSPDKRTILPLKQYLPDNGFTTVEFLDVVFNIPAKVSSYLAYHYGEDYVIPNPTWDYKDIEEDNIHAKYVYGRKIDEKHT